MDDGRAERGKWDGGAGAQAGARDDAAAALTRVRARARDAALTAAGTAAAEAPGFFAGLAVHPLNPKAWAMIVTGFTSFVAPGTSALVATVTIALCLFATQAVCHPIWTYFGDRIARHVSGTPYERYLMWTLAGLTVLFVLIAIFE